MTLLLSVCLAAVSFREPVVVPDVVSLSYRADKEVRLDASSRLVVRCPDGKAADWVRGHVRSWFFFEPQVTAEPEADIRSEGDEAYGLEAVDDRIILEARTLQGIRYAMFTLRQIAERDSSGCRVTGFRLPELRIEDAPALRFRGLHLCWMPEQSAGLVEREIRVAALHKFNYVVLESWGVFRSERHPWFGWKDGPMTKSVIRHLVEVARDLGVTLIPQINVWGHATASRSCTGKHAALDFSPAMQPLFEPGDGWNWCLSNPAARETIRDLVVEMHEAFGNPPYFHIGCDEASEPSCASCRAVPYSRLVCDHITSVVELLRTRGARALLWHDMLLRRGDPRWTGFYANGSAETAKLPKILPRDVIVCDWYYGNDPGGGLAAADRKSITGAYPTLDYFSAECGLDTLTCPWEEPKGIMAQMRYAKDRGLFGILETTWHHFGGERFPRMVQMSACGAWGGAGKCVSTSSFSMLWRQCGWDMGAGDYKESGWFDTQVSRDILGR